MAGKLTLASGAGRSRIPTQVALTVSVPPITPFPDRESSLMNRLYSAHR